MQSITRRSLPPGAYCDLVTPFDGGRVDIATLEHLTRWQIESGIAGIVVCGQAGEDTSLFEAEREAVIAAAVRAAAGEVPVLAGTGTNSTASTVALTRAAQHLGADGVFVVTPYYSKPSQEGVLRHLRAVVDAVDLPVVVCNAPQRTAIDLAPRSLRRIGEMPEVAGIADCTGDVGRLGAMNDGHSKTVRHYCGHDLTSFAFNLAGGSGTFSVAANVAPRLVAAMHVAIATGNRDAAAMLYLRLRPLMEVLEREPAACVAKQALHFIAGIDPEVRLPLVEIEPETAAAIRAALTALPHQGMRRLAG